LAEYARAVNDELFTLDFLFISLIHSYENTFLKQSFMYHPLFSPMLELYADTYILRCVSILEKIVLMTYNIVDFDNLYKSDKWRYAVSNDKKHSSMIGVFNNFLEIYPTLTILKDKINEYRALLKEKNFIEIRNNSTHIISNFRPMLGFDLSEDKSIKKITGSHASTNYRDIIEDKVVPTTLKTLVCCFESFLDEVLQKYNEDIS
jgi:hypothetical protein